MHPASPEPPTPSDAIRLYLQGRDAPCPHCNYNLRNCESPTCPECGRPILLHIGDADPRTFWDTLALIAVGLTSCYFVFRAVRRAITLFSGILAGSGLASIRADISLIAAVDLSIASLGVAWSIAIIRHHHQRPRPIFARPTTAATGLLLAVFIAFLFAYGARGIR